MVMRNDINRMQLISFVLTMNENDKTLELWSTLPVEGNGNVINDVVKHVRDNYELNDDDTLTVEFNCTSEKPNGSKIDSDTDFNASKIDKEARRLRLVTSGHSYHCKESSLRHNFEAHMNVNKSTNETSKDIEDESSSELPPKKNIYSKSDVDASDEKSSDSKIIKKRPVKVVWCKLCNKKLRSRSLQYHMTHVHEDVIKHACNICGKCFADKIDMEEHRRIHTNERRFTCHVCGKSVQTNAILVIHLKSHSDERPYECPICHNTYKYSHHFKKHYTVHTGEKNFVCDKCGKRFSCSTGMKRHMLIHNGLKPYQCHICYSMFNQRRYLKQHLVGKHRLDRNMVLTIVRNVKAQTQSGPVSENESESEMTEHQTEEPRINETE